MRDLPEYQRNVAIQENQPMDISRAVQNQINVLQNFMNTGTEVANEGLKIEAEQTKYTLQAQLSKNAADTYNTVKDKYADPTEQQKQFNLIMNKYAQDQVSQTNYFNRDLTKNFLQYYTNHYNEILSTAVQKQSLIKQQVNFDNTYDQHLQDFKDSINHVNHALGEKKWLPAMTFYANLQNLNKAGYENGTQHYESYQRNKKQLPIQAATLMAIEEAKHAYDVDGVAGLSKFKDSIPKEIIDNFKLDSLQQLNVETEVNKYVMQNLVGHEVSRSQLDDQIKNNIADIRANGGEPNNKIIAASVIYNGNADKYLESYNLASKIHNGITKVNTLPPQQAKPIIESIRNTLPEKDKDDFNKSMASAYDNLLKNPAKAADAQPSIKAIKESIKNSELAGNQINNSANSVPIPNIYSARVNWQERMGLNSVDANSNNYVKVLPADELNDLKNKIYNSAENKNFDELRNTILEQRQKMGSPRMYGILMNNLHSIGMPYSYFFIANMDPHDPNFKDVSNAILSSNNVLSDKNNAEVQDQGGTLSKLLNAQLADSTSNLSRYMSSINNSKGEINSEESASMQSAVLKTAKYLIGLNRSLTPKDAIKTATDSLLSNYHFMLAYGRDLAIPKQYDLNKIKFVIQSLPPTEIAKFPFSYNQYHKDLTLSEKTNRQNFINQILTGHWVMSSDGNSLVWATDHNEIFVGKNDKDHSYHPFTIDISDIENGHIENELNQQGINFVKKAFSYTPLIAPEREDIIDD